jgi:hypothetical protein
MEAKTIPNGNKRYSKMEPKYTKTTCTVCVDRK